MNTKLKFLATFAVVALTTFLAENSYADGNSDTIKGTETVTTGVYIRGVTLPGGGPAGQKTGKTCDFSNEPVNQHGRLEDASVNCRPGGNVANTLNGLPARFNAYCVLKAPGKGGNIRVIKSSMPGNPNHCSLSGITPSDATGQFKGSIWR